MATRGIAAQAWNYYREVIQQQWHFLSEQDLDEIAGDRDKLIAKIEERYGLTKRRAEDWLERRLPATV